MFRIKLKYFPYYISQYSLFFLVSIIFIFLYFIGLEVIIKNFQTSNQNSSTILLIPKSLDSYQEKKDSIFNYLSLNENIKSVVRIDNKEILKILDSKLSGITVSADLIPEVFKVEVKKGNKIPINIINKKINSIIRDAKIIQKKRDEKILVKTTLILIIIYITLYVWLQHSILTNALNAQKNLFMICKAFGVSTTTLTFNLFIGYILIFLTAIFFMNLLVLLVIQNLYSFSIIKILGIASFCLVTVNMVMIFINISIIQKKIIRLM